MKFHSTIRIGFTVSALYWPPSPFTKNLNLQATWSLWSLYPMFWTRIQPNFYLLTPQRVPLRMDNPRSVTERGHLVLLNWIIPLNPLSRPLWTPQVIIAPIKYVNTNRLCWRSIQLYWFHQNHVALVIQMLMEIQNCDELHFPHVKQY